MIQRTASMSFKDVADNKYTISVKDVKEEVDNLAVLALMDTIIDNSLIRTESGELVKKHSAQVVVKDTTIVEV